MKAKEAPEKIYRTTTYLDNEKGRTWWKTKPVAGAENIEYICTDVFIEKAKKYIANHFLAPGMDNEIKDFVNYMKGE